MKTQVIPTGILTTMRSSSSSNICRFGSAFLVVLLLCLSVLPGKAQGSASTAGNEAKWIAVLKSGAELKEKVDACRELSRVGTAEAIPALVQLLNDDKLSHSARYALESIPGKGPDRALRQALKTTQGRNLMGVITSIGVRHDESAVGSLKPFLAGPNPDVAQAAARALGKIGGGSAVTALEAVYSRTASTNLPAFREGLLRCADRFLADKKDAKAAAIYEWLKNQDGPPHFKVAVLRGRARSEPKSSVQILSEALSGPNYLEFAAACRTSHELTNAEVSQALIAAMKSASGDRQILLIQTIGIRRDAIAVGPLAAIAAQRPNHDARIAAIKSLGQIGTPSTLPFLSAFINDSDKDVANLAREAFVATPCPDVESMINRMLTNQNVETATMGLELAARRRMLGAYDQVVRLARGSEPTLRVLAIKKLADLAPSENASEPMKIFLQSSVAADLEASEQTMTTLSLRARDRESAASLISGAWTLGGLPQQKSMLNILTAIGGTNALRTVRDAIGSSTQEIHSAAIRSLGAWNSLDAAPDLLKLAQSTSDATEKMLCLRSYMRLVTESDLKPEQRLDLCKQAQTLAQQPEEKKLLLSVLGGIGSPLALELIRPHLGDASVAEEAQNGVLRIAEKALQAKKPELELVLPSLEQVVREAGSPTIKTRAEQLLQQAKAKASQP